MSECERGCGCLLFFQAEDGIRDIGVTGVQTCALPICPLARVDTGPDLPGRGACPPDQVVSGTRRKKTIALQLRHGNLPGQGPFSRVQRSEERRVGKECRSRWLPDY